MESNQTAAQKFAELLKIFNALVEDLQAQIQDLDNRQRESPGDWEVVHDMEQAVNGLGQLVDSVSNALDYDEFVARR